MGRFPEARRSAIGEMQEGLAAKQKASQLFVTPKSGVAFFFCHSRRESAWGLGSKGG
jgi:hypothetical protein